MKKHLLLFCSMIISMLIHSQNENLKTKLLNNYFSLSIEDSIIIAKQAKKNIEITSFNISLHSSFNDSVNFLLIGDFIETSDFIIDTFACEDFYVGMHYALYQLNESGLIRLQIGRSSLKPIIQRKKKIYAFNKETREYVKRDKNISIDSLRVSIYKGNEIVPQNGSLHKKVHTVLPHYLEKGEYYIRVFYSFYNDCPYLKGLIGCTKHNLPKNTFEGCLISNLVKLIIV